MTVPADRPKPQPSGHFVLVPERVLPRIVIRSPRHIKRGTGGLLAASAARAAEAFRLRNYNYRLYRPDPVAEAEHSQDRLGAYHRTGY